MHNSDSKVNKMYTYLRGYLSGAGLQQSIKALQYARDKHNGQFRKNGQPYIVHPLSMACYAVALGIKEDNIIATILLHDVVEDCGVELDTMPFNSDIRRGVSCMTFKKPTSDSTKEKIMSKKNYFNYILNSREAVVCKAIDRYNNLIDMEGNLSNDNIGKNLAETELLLIPTLREAKHKYIDISNILFILRTNIESIVEIMKHYHSDEYNEWLKRYKDI